MADPAFWDDPETAQSVLRRQKSLTSVITEFGKLSDDWEELQTTLQLCGELEDDPLDPERTYQKQLAADAAKLHSGICHDLAQMELALLLTGEYDETNAILSIHSGAGGNDAQDWAEILLRMYRRWAEGKGFKVSLWDFQPDTEAGIKAATLFIEGENAYGYLKSEKGVHRLVRISPYNTSGKRMTSFASVDVMPEIETEAEVDINPEDLEIQTYRASGAGGQHVNTTDSAVRIIHKPTGIVVQCQNERSQTSNKSTALKMLASKLMEIKIAEQKEKISDIAGDYSQIAWGSQIRSYVFQPYTMVKDHRTNEETGNVGDVIDGEIDIFIQSYLRSQIGLGGTN